MRRWRSGAAVLAAGAVAAVACAVLVGCAARAETDGEWRLWPVGPPAFQPPGSPPFTLIHQTPPDPEPETESAPAAAPVRPPEHPDLRFEQAVVTSDGSTFTCFAEISAVADPPATDGDDAARQASEFLRTTDWATVLSEPPASPVPQYGGDPGTVSTGGRVEAEQRAAEIGERIVRAVFERGLPPRFVIFSSTGCG